MSGPADCPVDTDPAPLERDTITCFVGKTTTDAKQPPQSFRSVLTICVYIVETKQIVRGNRKYIQ